MKIEERYFLANYMKHKKLEIQLDLNFSKIRNNNFYQYLTITQNLK
jgi:hypothetical protein